VNEAKLDRPRLRRRVRASRFAPAQRCSRAVARAAERPGRITGRIGRAGAGFTLIELIIVLAILSLLLTIAVPRYFTHVERTKEATLKQDLNVMRDAIDKFYGDKGRYPDSLDELVSQRYIRNIPVDPITDASATWKVIAPPDPDTKGAVYDVKSGAEGNSLDGKPYSEW